MQKLKEWTITSGKIIQCNWGMEGHQVWPKIEYMFQIGDIDYINDVIFYDLSYRTVNHKYERKIAYAMVMAFKSNETVTVYYNPQNPKEAVLNVSIPGKLIIILGLICGLLALHLFFITYHYF